MIELARESATLFLAWTMGLTIVYGICESSLPPIVGARVLFSSIGAPAWWGEILVYCPYCIGFWIHGIIGLGVELTPWSFARGASLWIASLLLLRAAFDVSLVRSRYEDELEAIDEMRQRRKKEI